MDEDLGEGRDFKLLRVSGEPKHTRQNFHLKIMPSAKRADPDSELSSVTFGQITGTIHGEITQVTRCHGFLGKKERKKRRFGVNIFFLCWCELFH